SATGRQPTRLPASGRSSAGSSRRCRRRRRRRSANGGQPRCSARKSGKLPKVSRRWEGGPGAPASSTAFRKSGVAEVGGLCDGGRVHEFSDAAQNQHRGKVRWNHVGLADVEVTQLEFIELARRR